MKSRFPRSPLILLAALGIAVLSGCSGKPDAANIELRKQNQQLTDHVAQLDRQRDADRATIRGLQSHLVTVPLLPQDRVNELFTACGLQFRDLTGGYRPDPALPADTMVKIYVVPIDQQGQPIKAAGSFHVELFDLALKNDNRIGQWDFDLKASRDLWYGSALLYNYVLDCPWQTPPRHAKLTLRVTFTDALTQRIFTTDRDITVIPPG